MNTEKSKVEIAVQLDDCKMPEKITWRSEEEPQWRETEAFLLAFWDAETKNTMQLDIWSKKMTVDEMRFFVCQRLFLLAETLDKSTGDKEASHQIHQLAVALASQYGFIKKT